MSEAQPVGESGTPTPTNGAADPTEGSVARSPETPAPEVPAIGDDAGADRFRSYYRENPDKAAEKLIEFQRAADKAQGRLKSYEEKLGDLGPIVERVGGEGIAKWLNDYATLRAHPTFGPYVQQLEQGGQLPASLTPQGGDDDEDEYLDPAVKSLRDEMAEIKRQNDELRRELSGVTSETGMAKFQGHVKEVFKDWQDGLSEEQHQQIQEGMERDLRQLDPRVISKMNRDGVETLMLKHLLKSGGLMEAAKRRVLREEQGKREASTGVPSGVVSPGVEQTKARPSALEAFREAQELARQGRL